MNAKSVGFIFNGALLPQPTNGVCLMYSKYEALLLRKDKKVLLKIPWAFTTYVHTSYFNNVLSQQITVINQILWT